MTNTWVVVADSGSARIFTADSPTGSLKEFEDFDHPEARVRERMLVSDRPGRLTGPGGRQQGTDRREGPQKHEAMSFAHLLADRMSKARAAGSLDHIVLVAAPEFLGMLRKALDDETRSKVEREFSLDLVGMKPAEIRAHLPEDLYSAH
jgi:protein required for attachment to host cells